MLCRSDVVGAVYVYSLVRTLAGATSAPLPKAIRSMQVSQQQPLSISSRDKRKPRHNLHIYQVEDILH